MLGTFRKYGLLIKAQLTKFRFPLLLPRLYLKILVFGLVLVGLNYSYIPDLTYCSGLFGGNFCSPVGIYLIAFASLPGYLVVNAVWPNFAASNDSVYSFIVFGMSLLLYTFFGYLFSKKKNFKLRSVNLIYLVFLILLVILLILLSMISS
jgi:hypothetical protein